MKLAWLPVWVISETPRWFPGIMANSLLTTMLPSHTSEFLQDVSERVMLDFEGPNRPHVDDQGRSPSSHRLSDTSSRATLTSKQVASLILWKFV